MKKFLLSILLIFGFIVLYANEPGGSNGFIPNGGQWHPQVLYRMSIPNGAMFLENGGFSYTFYDGSLFAEHHLKEIKDVPEKIKTHTVRVKLEGALQHGSLNAEQGSVTRYNYYLGNDQTKWASGLQAFQTVTYPEVYPGTDLKFYLTKNRVKYDFILEPGANPASIRMNYQGAESVVIREGKLWVKTSLGDITEQAPVAWQTNGVEKIPVRCNFVQNEDGTIGFETETLHPAYNLIIDPQIVFATYSGSIDDNWGFTATNDNEGNGYAAGVVFGANFQTTTGAAQENFGGGTVDIGVIKYNPTGTQALYITYLGGNRSEFPHSLIVNEFNELLMFGSTGSANFPTTSGAYSSTFMGGTSTGFSIMTMPNGSDIFISRFSVNGDILLASSLVGGTKNDGLNVGNNNDLVRNYADQTRGALWVDADNNVYVGTSTLSDDFPGTTGRFQATYGGGGQDGIVLKMNGNLSKLLWASYLGGEASDGIFYLTVDNDMSVVVTGGTRSNNFPVSTNAWKKTFGGGVEPDGFVTKLDSSGTQMIASTYVGTAQYDQSYIAGTDHTDNIYLFGQTSSTGTDFVVNSPIAVAGGNQFIIKFSPMLDQVVWSTTFGKATGRPDISPTALLVDVCDKIYVCGWGGYLNGPFGASISGLVTTPGAIKNVTDGNDFYLYVINSQASTLEYASFFGGNLSRDHVDGGTSRFDKKGIIYQAICASCGGYDDLPVTPGAYSPTNNSSNCNNALIKIDLESPIVISSFVLSNPDGVNLSAPVGCAPFNVKFKNTSINATLFTWKINGEVVSSDKDLIHLFNNSGTYEITLIVNSSASCNVFDTSAMTLTVFAAIESSLSDLKACKGTQVRLGPEGLDDPYYTFNWTPTIGLDNPKGRRPKLNASVDTTYRLVVSMGACTDTLFQKIHIEGSRIDLAALGLCQGDTTSIGITEPAPDSTIFSWSPTGSLSNPAVFNPKAFPGVTTTYRMLMQKEGQVCPDTVVQRIDVGQGSRSTLPVAKACLGDSIQMGPNPALPNAVSATWSPASGLSNPAVQNPKAIATVSKDYVLVLAKTGCNDTLEQRLEVSGQVLPDFTLVEACMGDSAQIGFVNPLAGTGISYTWLPASQYSNNAAYNPMVLIDGDHTYTLVVGWPLPGCEDTLEAPVKALLDPFNAGADVTACPGLPASIGIPDQSGQYTYAWSPASLAVTPQSAATMVQVTEATWFYLLRTPAGTTPGCKGVDSLLVSLEEQPIAGFGMAIIPACNELGVQLIDSSQSASDISWMLGEVVLNGQDAPFLHVPYGDSLQITQIAINGVCRDSLLKAEKLKNIEDYYKLQDVNAFSPNGDGKNDCFSPALQPLSNGTADTTFVECSTLLIFNRWGDKLFDSEQEQAAACWDGRSSGGNEVPEGVYYFSYSFKGVVQTGYVHLRRN